LSDVAAVTKRNQEAKVVEIYWGALISRTDLSR